MNGRPPLSKSSALVLSPTADCSAQHPPASAPTSMSTSAPASVAAGNGPAHEGGASSAQASAAQTQTTRGFKAERGAPPIYKNSPRFASSEMLRGWRPPGPRGPFNAPFANLNGPSPSVNGFRFNARGSGFGPGPFPYANGPNRPPFQRISPMPKSAEPLSSTRGITPPQPNWRCGGSPLQSALNQNHSNSAAANRAEQPVTTTTAITSTSSSSSSNSTSAWPANPYISSYAAITAKRNAAGGMCPLPARNVAIARTQSVTASAASPALPPPPGLLPPRLGSFSEKHSSSDSGSASGSASGSGSGSGAPEPPAQNAPKTASAATGAVGQPIGAPSGKEVQVAPLEVDVGIGVGVGSEQREGRLSQRPSESDSGLAGCALSTQRESAPDSPLAHTECCSEVDTRTGTGPPTRTQSLADAAASDAAEAADTTEAADTAYKAHESASSEPKPVFASTDANAACEPKPVFASTDANAACEPKRSSNSTASARKKSSSAPPSASECESASGSGCGKEATGEAAAPPPKSGRAGRSARRRAAHKLRAADHRDPKTQSNDSAEYCSAHSSSPSPTHSASAGHKNTDRSSIVDK